MSKPDLVSIEPLRPQSMEELARHFTIHQLTMDKSTWVDAVKPLGDRVRFVQTTGFAGCPGPVMAALLLVERDGGLEGARGEALRVLLHLFERDAAVPLMRSG